MLIIRLKRTGRKNDPAFKIVVGEKEYSPKSGKHLAYLGSYNPHTKVTVVDADAVKGWIAKGAQLSDTIHNLFVTKGIIEGKKINILPSFKEPEKPAEEAPTAAPAAETPADAAPEVEASPEEAKTEEAAS